MIPRSTIVLSSWATTPDSVPRARRCHTRADDGPGLQYRPHPLGAAIALEQFKNLDTWNSGRRDNFDYLMEGLSDLPALAVTRTPDQAERGGYYGTRILYDSAKLVGISRGALLKALRAEGVPVDIERYLCFISRPTIDSDNGRMMAIWRPSFARTTTMCP